MTSQEKVGEEPDAKAYQNVRLWAGITSIGFNLALISFLALSTAWWTPDFLPPGWDIFVLGFLALAIAAVNLPLDFLSGFAIEKAFRNTAHSPGEWLQDWAMGRGLAAFAVFLGFLLFWFNHETEGSHFVTILLMACAGIGAAIVMTPTGFKAPAYSKEHRFEQALQGELRKLSQRDQRVCWFENGEVRFVNGYLSPFGLLCLSTTVAEELTPREAALLAAREHWFRTSGASLVIAAVVVIWSLLGLLLALLVPASSGLQAALGGSAVVTFWCFLALFIWPSLNRQLMTKADCFLLSFAPRDEVSSLLKKIQILNKTDISLPSAKTLVFHPIPPLEDRIHSLS